MIPFLRAIGAVALTGAISPLVFSAGYGAFHSIATGGPFSVELVLFIAFYGTLFALPLASIMGMFVEYPKLLWLKKDRGLGLPIQLVFSVVGAWSLLVLIVTITEGRLPRLDQRFEDYFFAALAFAIGGLTSGIAWWALVARHTPKKNSSAR